LYVCTYSICMYVPTYLCIFYVCLYVRTYLCMFYVCLYICTYVHAIFLKLPTSQNSVKVALLEEFLHLHRPHICFSKLLKFNGAMTIKMQLSRRKKSTLKHLWTRVLWYLQGHFSKINSTYVENRFLLFHPHP
jgi:hypothetical protein